MNQTELPQSFDLRQQIHDLTLTKRSTGLSPPEEEILEALEAMEFNDKPWSSMCSRASITQKEIKIMNYIEVEAPITRVTDYPNALGIQCHDNMITEKVSRFTTRVIGDDFERWKGKLKEGDIIKFRGNVAEAKQGTCGAYMVIYNPVIIDAFRLRPESLGNPEHETDFHEQEKST